MLQNGYDVYASAFRGNIAPVCIMPLDEWADKNRYVPYKPIQGQWQTSRTPYLREPMRELSYSSHTQKVVVMKAAQMGFTEAGYNWIYYIIANCLGSVISIMPIEDLVKDMVRQKVDSSILAMPDVKKCLIEDNIKTKIFPGGTAVFGGSGSPAKMRAQSFQYIHKSDLDGFIGQAGAEGDPSKLLDKRATAFGRRKKIYEESTPTTIEASRIYASYQDSDQREYHVPCPECGEYQPLKWENLHYEVGDSGRVGNIYYKCVNGCVIGEQNKTQMLNNGVWIAKNPGHPVAGFAINALYLPAGWDGWKVLAQEYAEAEKHMKLGDDRDMRAFVNTRLGLPYEGKTEKSDWQELYNRREMYAAEVPEGVGVLTFGADVQHDRVEVSTWGFGANEESWLICHEIFRGAPATTNVLDLLDALAARNFKHESGCEMPITCGFIDSGDQTKIVYDWVQGKEYRGIYACKGENQYGKPAVSRSPKSSVDQVDLYRIGTDTLKSVIMEQVRLITPGAAYIHIPYNVTDEYCKQFCGESLQLINQKGRLVRRWKQTYPHVETLDCYVYAKAAYALAKSLGVDAGQLAEMYRNNLVSVGAVTNNHARPKENTEHKTQERRRW